MKRLILMLIIVCIPSITFAVDEWTTHDTLYQIATLTTFAVDWAQTKEITRNPDYWELNKILGEHPSQNAVDCYFVGVALFHTGVSYLLPRPYRRYFQLLTIGFQSHAIYRNYSIGIRINF